jgi:hypothetical protein
MNNERQAWPLIALAALVLLAFYLVADAVGPDRSMIDLMRRPAVMNGPGGTAAQAGD